MIDICFPARYIGGMKLLMSLLEAVLLLTGAGSAEELAESEFERFEALSAHPVCINLASAGRLRSCGLFSEYQVASLQDYRERTGDILSLTELGTVPGFTPELVCALAWFISLESYNPAGTREKTRIRQEAMGRMTVKKGSGSLRDASVAYAGKYHLEAGERADLYLSWKTGPTASVTVYGRRPWKLIAGDYNVRLGQGLLVWDGFLLSGYPSVASFRRNASGFSGTGSFTPGRRGLATAYDGRRWQVSAGLFTGDGNGGGVGSSASGAGSVVGGAAGSASWLGRSGSVGVNALCGRGGSGISLDWKKAFGHLATFGEMGYAFSSGKASLLVGSIWEPAYKLAFSVLGRYRPSADDAGIAAGFQRRWLSLTADLTVHPEKYRLRKNNYEQIKVILNAAPEFSRGPWMLKPMLRWAERLQLSPSGDAFQAVWRHDLRCDLKASRRWLQTCLRLNGVHITDLQTGSTSQANHRPGGLAFLEVGYKTPSDTARLQVSAYLRGTVCDTENWASRIYAYERDLPGSFSVPAWYGRKAGLSLVAGVTCRRRKATHRLNLHASTRDFKLQYQIRL